MRAGELDRQITIQRSVTTFSPSGQPIPQWQAIVHRRWSSVRPVRGDQRFQADQFIAKQQVEFRIRFSADVANINPIDRVVYPAPADGDDQNPPLHMLYDIMEVQEIGRREGLLISAARRAEGGAS